MHANIFCGQGYAVKAVWRPLCGGMFALHIGSLSTVSLGIFSNSHKGWFVS